MSVRKHLSLTILILTIAICFYAIYKYWDNFKDIPLSPNLDEWGTFGDYIGGVVGTTLTFATALYLILTLQSQNRTKNDNVFFYLLSLHDKQFNNVRGQFGADTLTGREYFRKITEDCCRKYYIHGLDENKVKGTLSESLNLFDSYLLNFNEVISFILNADRHFFSDQSRDFKNIFIAQLSNEEKIILGYMCAFGLVHRQLFEFYVKEKIHTKIVYEEHLDYHGNLKPDAIKNILYKLNNMSI